jgi:CheY-like chemotaxis protein
MPEHMSKPAGSHGTTPCPLSTILIVDDDPQIRTWLHHVLEDRGYQVRGVEDGKEALAYFERTKPALIVLDLFMPNMDGAEVMMYLRSTVQSIKILAISGYIINGYDLTQTAIVLGAHDALAKPFSAEEFLHRVDVLLSHT